MRAALLALWLCSPAWAQLPRVYFEVDPPGAEIEIVSMGESHLYQANREQFLKSKGDMYSIRIRASGYREGVLEMVAAELPRLPEHWPKDGVYRLQPASWGAYLQRFPLWIGAVVPAGAGPFSIGRFPAGMAPPPEGSTERDHAGGGSAMGPASRAIGRRL